MRFDEVAHQRKPDAEPRVSARHRCIRLPEKIEHARENLQRDTDPRVSNANDGLTGSHTH